MPLVRYEIQNECKLGNLELYRTASKDDPKSMLEGVTMVGLVGLLRQLGDLAEFAAELFHDLHEEVMATAARGHDLVARVLQLEGEVPYIEKVLSNSDPLRFFSVSVVDWHATIRSDQNHFTQGDLPRFIRSSYEECREPPRLFLLDKFDVGGAEACLKRYTDPSFFKKQWASTELTKAEKSQRERKARRGKKKAIRRTNNEGVNNPALAPCIKPRRVRYSSLSSDNLDCFLDSASLLSTGNQFNSSFKPMDVSIPENNENIPLNTMSISTFKEPTSSSSISRTTGLTPNNTKDPAEAVMVEALSMTSRDQELPEERGMTFGSSSKVNEEQSMLDKEEEKAPVEVFSPKKIANNFSIDSDRFEDATTAHSETDSDIVKLHLDDNDDGEDDGDENFNVQVRDAESNSKVDFVQETGQISVRTPRFLKGSIADAGRLVENSGILQEHAEILKISVSGVTSELDIYEDAMNAHYGNDSEVGANQLISFAISDKHLENQSISTTFLQYQEGNEAENSPQMDHDSIQIQEGFPLESQLDAVGTQSSVEDFDASKLRVSKNFKKDDYDTGSVDDDTSKFEASLGLREQLLTGTDILAGQVESESLSTVDLMLNRHVEVLAKEEFVPDTVESRGGLSWKTSETSIDRRFEKDVNIPPEYVLALKELISNSSSDLDKFEDTIGSELDTGSEPTSEQELKDISSLQGISAKTVCTALPFPEFCNYNKLETVQKIPEDLMQDDLEADGWRQSDVLLIAPEPTNKNSLGSSRLGDHPLDLVNEKSDELEVVAKLLHLDNAATSDDLCETDSKSLQASDLANKLQEVCDEKLFQPEHMPLHTMASNVTGLPNDLVSKMQQIVGTIKHEKIIDNVLVEQTGFADSKKSEQPDDVLASMLAVGKDAQVSVADFREQAQQTMGSKSGLSAYGHIERVEEELFEEDSGIDNEAHMKTFGRKHDPLSLLKPLQLTTDPPTDMLCSNDAEFVETVSAFSDSSGPSSVPFKLVSYDPSHSRTSSENYREGISAQGSSIKEGSQSIGLESSDLLIAKPAAHADALFDTDAGISTQWPKAEHQRKLKNFLPFTSRSPPLSPISSFELPAGLHKLHEKVRDSTDENSNQLQMDQTAKPRLSLDVSLDDSPAISPIVSPMWSSESPTACAEHQELFAEDLDERILSQSPLLPSSPTSPTTSREQHEFISDSELRHSVGSSPRGALNTLASSTVSVPSEGLISNYIDKKGVSPFPLTSSPSLSATSTPTSPACGDSGVDDFDEECKASEVLSYVPIPSNGELLIPQFESVTSEPSLNKPKPDALGPLIQPAPLSMKGSPSTEIGTSSLPMKRGSTSPDSLKSPDHTSKDELPLNEAEESFSTGSPELRSTIPSSVKLEENILPSFSSEGELSTTCEELSSSTQAAPAPAPPAPTPPRKPPKGFHGLSRALTTKPSSGDHGSDLVDSISTSSLSQLRNASIQAPPRKPKNVNHREGLLEQIRTQSFNLRHTTVEKKHALPSRPVRNINVAAILEKAYSMRQALVGSDEDEDSDGWSDQ